MREGINFDKYIDNPNGGSVAVITNRKMYKDLYTNKFGAILLREEGKINFKVYHSSDKYDTYYIHMKIPSEVIAQFYYDIVVQLSTTIGPKKSSSSLRQYMVRFFSNDPAFVFTFAHAFSKNDLFIHDLKPRMVTTALSQVARTRNPKDEVFYVKSLYFAYLTMEKYNLFSRSILDSNAEKYDKNKLLKEIEPASKKIDDRREAQEKLNTESFKEKTEKKEITNPTATSKITKTSTVSKITPATKKVKTSKAVKRK